MYQGYIQPSGKWDTYQAVEGMNSFHNNEEASQTALTSGESWRRYILGARR
jgi:hypothetical protein